VARHGGCEAPRALDGLAVLAEILCVLWVELSDLSRPDPAIVDVPSNRCVEVAHHDSDLHLLSKNRLVHFDP